MAGRVITRLSYRGGVLCVMLQLLTPDVKRKLYEMRVKYKRGSLSRDSFYRFCRKLASDPRTNHIAQKYGVDDIEEEVRKLVSWWIAYT